MNVVPLRNEPDLPPKSEGSSSDAQQDRAWRVRALTQRILQALDAGDEDDAEQAAAEIVEVLHSRRTFRVAGFR